MFEETSVNLCWVHTAFGGSPSLIKLAAKILCDSHPLLSLEELERTTLDQRLGSRVTVDPEDEPFEEKRVVNAVVAVGTIMGKALFEHLF